jgi:hypothetical protein
VRSRQVFPRSRTTKIPFLVLTSTVGARNRGTGLTSGLNPAPAKRGNVFTPENARVAEVPDFIVCPRMLSYVHGIGIGALYFSRL